MVTVGWKTMIRIPESIFQGMIEHARRQWPLECCGILAGGESTVKRSFEMTNSEQSPVRYSMAPEDQLRAYDEMDRAGMEMVAIYHSHPHTIAFPSETDVKLTVLPELISIIVSLKQKEDPEVKAFRIGEEAIYPQEIEIMHDCGMRNSDFGL
jgi:proteasome lid subunit RPN8/RPN11